jgi:hypothetical protein
MRLSISLEEPLPKGKPDKDIANCGNTLYHTAIYTIIQTTFELLKHMNQNIKKLGNLSPGPRKKHFYIIIRNYGLISVFKEIV